MLSTEALKHILSNHDAPCRQRNLPEQGLPLILRQEVLREVHRRLGRAAVTAEAYRELAGPEWGPKVGAWVCAAHFLEHHLREGPAHLLLLDLQV